MPHQARIAQWKSEGKTIVFTNGVFDILHVGHVTYLQEAKALGDILVVGLNADSSVKRLNKGPERPINDEQSRKKVLEALRCVDEVIIFDEDTPLSLIMAIRPKIIVKGGDYSEHVTDRRDPRYVVGSQEVRKWGGKAHVLAFVQGYSTTNIVKKMRD
jgi:D-beta-D-heptose 7-phosphate kinase/D-beta-D-heptose 1-phosphate adenosyltransferase